jgi:hypothetical protein
MTPEMMDQFFDRLESALKVRDEDILLPEGNIQSSEEQQYREKVEQSLDRLGDTLDRIEDALDQVIVLLQRQDNQEIGL